MLQGECGACAGRHTFGLTASVAVTHGTPSTVEYLPPHARRVECCGPGDEACFQGPRTWVDGGWREAHTLPVTSLGSAKPRAGTAPVQRRQQRVPEQLVRQPQLGLQRAPAPEHRREPVEPTTTRALLGRLWQLRPRGQAPLAGTRRAARPRTWRAAAAAARVQAQPCARKETCAYHLKVLRLGSMGRTLSPRRNSLWKAF